MPRRTTQEEIEILRKRYAAIIPEIRAYAKVHPDRWGRERLTVQQCAQWAKSVGIELDGVGVGLYRLIEEGIA